MTGNTEQIAEKIKLVEAEDEKMAIESLAALALRDHRLDILKFCLDRGFIYAHWFIDEANSLSITAPDSDISKLLQASEFWHKHPRPTPEAEEGPERQ